MKETFYFPHDMDAHSDPKIMELLCSCSVAGLGFYWIIIEILHQQEDGRITLAQFRQYLSFYLKIGDGVDSTLVEHLLNKIEQNMISENDDKLLLKTGDLISSNRVDENKKFRQSLSKKRSAAGKKSAEARASATSVEHMSTSVEQNATKERKMKGKENEKKESLSEIEQARPDKRNLEISKMLEALKTKIGITDFADSSIERNLAKHCVGLLGKLGKDEFVRRLDLILQDDFKRKNCNRIRFVYSEIKAFIEPKNKEILSV